MGKTAAILVALLLIPLAFAIELNTSSTNIESQYADLYVSVLKYEPFPVGPGEYFDLWLQVENKGRLDAKNVKFMIQPRYPFFLDPNEDANRTIDGILSHSGAVVHYKVRVDENAVEGNTLLDYSYSINSKNPVGGQVEIAIQTLKAILSVENVKTVPETVAPGENANITITVRNNADSYLKYVTAAMQLVYSSSATAAASTFVELPFTPIGSGNEKSVYQIAPGEKLNFNFNIVVSPDAEVKPYKLPIAINYFDELGKNYSKMEIVGIIVGSKPDIYSMIDSTDLKGEGQSGEIKIKFVNKGTSPIKFLNVRLKESKEYNIVSSDQAYIGKIDSDDYDTATFRIYLKNLRSQKADIPINYEFMDGNNKKYSVDETLPLEIHSSKELGTGGGSGGIIIFAVIVIIVVYLVYRKWGRKRKKK
jgi:hypothetical protein